MTFLTCPDVAFNILLIIIMIRLFWIVFKSVSFKTQVNAGGDLRSVEHKYIYKSTYVKLGLRIAQASDWSAITRAPR